MLKKSVLCKYPIQFLEDKLHGIMTGDFIVIAAGTSVGKSTISRILTQNAVDCECPVVLYSLEDEPQTFVSDSVYREVLKSQVCLMDFREWLVNNTLHPEKYRDAAMAAAKRSMLKDRTNGIPLQIVHEMQISDTWNLNTIIKSMDEEIRRGYKLFILDHLDVLVPSEKPDDMVRTINALWRFVAEKQIALITFSQLSTGRNRESLCPGIDDLRGSKAKVHTPTIVISVARHNYGYYSLPDNANASPTYIRILKNRQGGRTCASVSYFDRGNYLPTYMEVECNDSGTRIDNMTSKELSRHQKESQ